MCRSFENGSKELMAPSFRKNLERKKRRRGDNPSSGVLFQEPGSVLCASNGPADYHIECSHIECLIYSNIIPTDNVGRGSARCGMLKRGGISFKRAGREQDASGVARAHIAGAFTYILK